MLKEFAIKGWQTGNTVITITKTMAGLGDGATGILFGFRGPGKVGHFFNVVNKKGVIEFLDFQKTGVSAEMQSAEFEGYKDLWFINTTK